MNFIQAICLANAGCRIRRAAWAGQGSLVLDKHKDLIWTGANVAAGFPSRILGRDSGVDLTSEDLTAEDWEYEDND